MLRYYVVRAVHAVDQRVESLLVEAFADILRQCAYGHQTHRSLVLVIYRRGEPFPIVLAELHAVSEIMHDRLRTVGIEAVHLWRQTAMKTQRHHSFLSLAGSPVGDRIDIVFSSMLPLVKNYLNQPTHEIKDRADYNGVERADHKKQEQ